MASRSKLPASTREQLLVDGHREVVGPELREALEEGAVGAGGKAEACRHLAHVDRPEELPDLLQL